MPESDRARLLPDDEEEEDEGSEVRSRRSASDERFSDGSPQASAVDTNAVMLEVLSSQVVAAFVVAFHTRSGELKRCRSSVKKESNCGQDRCMGILHSHDEPRTTDSRLSPEKIKKISRIK